MIIRLKISSLKRGRWYEYAVRFALGGLSTLVAGIIADPGDQRPAGCYSSAITLGGNPKSPASNSGEMWGNSPDVSKGLF